MYPDTKFTECAKDPKMNLKFQEHFVNLVSFRGFRVPPLCDFVSLQCFPYLP